MSFGIVTPPQKCRIATHDGFLFVIKISDVLFSWFPKLHATAFTVLNVNEPAQACARIADFRSQMKCTVQLLLHFTRKRNLLHSSRLFSLLCKLFVSIKIRSLVFNVWASKAYLTKPFLRNFRRERCVIPFSSRWVRSGVALMPQYQRNTSLKSLP